jgi:hypothetical protein
VSDSDNPLGEFIESLIYTEETKLEQFWWLFISPAEPRRPDGVSLNRQPWPPFLGTRVELGGESA